MPYNEAMTYEQKCRRVLAQFHASSGVIGLNKKTSNLFRDRREGKKQRLDVRGFNQVIKIDTDRKTITAEGMTTFEDLTDAALNHGLLPLVVPELKTITIGGAVSGMAIESSSFRYGLVHESVLEMDILTPKGKIVTATPANEYKDLFFGLPNSYGTLGYVLKLTVKAREAQPFVRLEHLKFRSAAGYFAELEKIAVSGNYNSKKISFVDGMAVSKDEMYITVGTETQTAPYVSDYTHMKQYYRSISERTEDYLTMHDYIWRWDTDWFWCSKNVFADKPLVRRVLGKKRLRSSVYMKLVQFEKRYRVVQRLQKITRTSVLVEEVIQDIEVPIDRAEAFLASFQHEVGISPLWVCPTHTPSDGWPYPLYPMKPGTLYVNFGFWDVIPARGNPDDAYYNKWVERTVEDLGGMKSLYSSSYYPRPKFDRLYGGTAYAKLKKKYDPKGRFKNLYAKCVKNG